jgi:hypothetical protein
MKYGTWHAYEGVGSIWLAIALAIVAGILIYFAIRLRSPIDFKRPQKSLGVVIVITWILSAFAFLFAAAITGSALVQQAGHITPPVNPITPFTFTFGVMSLFVIVVLTQNLGFRGALGSALVGVIAAPLIFELPFDLIIMGRVYLPSPHIAFMLLYFLPLISVELLGFAMLMLSPVTKLSRATLLFLAAMFLLFAAWALFGFAYPSAPLPIVFNVTSKLMAFAASISLFIPHEQPQDAMH